MGVRFWVGVLSAIVMLMLLVPVVCGEAGSNFLQNSTPQPGNSDKDYVDGELIVMFQPTLPDDQVKMWEITGRVHSAIGGNMKRDLGRAGSSRVQLVKLPQGMSVEEGAARYAKNPFVLYAEPNHKLHITAVPDDPQYPDLWAMQTLGAPDAWDRQTGSPGVIVAVIDTGVDYTHPDLRDNMWVNADEIPANGIDDDGNGYIDDVNGWDFYNEDNNPMDDHGHGTHCAGTIGAAGNNGLGVTGLAWHVKIMPLKFLSGTGYGTDAGATAAILYARENGVTIVSNSYGGTGGSQSLRAAIEGSPALFICAAGNAGADADTNPFYPAAFPSANIISVAATGQGDTLASFSNYGDVSVDLAAPGVGIWSTKPGGGYQSMSGTSMATPHVAGIAALIKSQHPGYTPAQIKSAILSGVDPVPALSGRVLTGGRASAANPLYATFFANTTTGPVPLSVQFSPVPDDASSWFWEFGDGGTSSLKNPVHVYQIPGTYSVSLSSTYGIAHHTFSRPGAIVAGDVPMPDLVVTAVDGPSAATPGQAIQISTTVKNAGTGATGNGFLVRLYLSTDQTISVSDTYLGERQVPALAAGATNTASTSVVIPAQIPLGEYYVGAVVDAGTQIAESVESNNAGYDPLRLTITAVSVEGPDLVISYIDAPVSGVAGKTVALTSLVKNEGTAPPGAVSYARFYLSADQKIMTTDLYLGQRSILSSLAPGGTSSGTTTVTIPATVTEGTYYVGAIADATGLVTESKENNNAACDSTAIAISAAPKPDLVVTTVDSPSAGAAGGAIAVTSTVKNIGTSSPGSISYVRFYLSADQTITTADLYLGQRYVSSSLAPGTSSSGTTSVTIPATVTPGTYYAGAIADATNIVGESDENNNAACDSASIVISASPKPDLVISSLDAPAGGKRGSYLKITSTVKNQGLARSTSSYLKFYLSADSVITTGDRYIGQRTVTTLNPGVTSTASSYVTLSTSITPGSYYLGAIADATNIVGESDENNNIAVDQGPVGITSY